MILQKSREFAEGATAYLLAQRYRGWHKMTAMMMVSHELPRPMVASELKRLRRQIRVNIARTERRRLNAERRAVGL